MRYVIQHSTTPRVSFGDYEYEIHESDKLIARYWHDYRGDGHSIAFIGGKKWDDLPGRMLDFLTGGGPEPTELTQIAIDFLDENRPK
jgi:hypothetical protein